jgi:hypothetical protein
MIRGFKLFLDLSTDIDTGGGSGTASPATPRKRKGASGDGDGTPAKKRTPSKKSASFKKRVVDVPGNDIGGGGEDDDLPDDMADFSKSSI